LQAGEQYLGVQAGVGLVQAGIGEVEPAILEGERGIVPEEVVGARAHLDIELEAVTQIGLADVGIGDADSAVHEWDPGTARREVITNQRREAEQGAVPGAVLDAAPELADQLRVAAVPPVLGLEATEHPAEAHRSQRELVALLAAEGPCP